MKIIIIKIQLIFCQQDEGRILYRAADIHGKADEKILEKKLQNAIAIHYFLGSWLIKNNDYLPQKNRLSYMPISELYQIFKEYPVICTDSQMSA